MTRKLTLFIAALFLCGAMQAQTYHWSYNFHDYENNFPFIGEVYLDGVALASSDFEIAAFVGNQVRATEFLFEADPSSYPGRHYAWLGVAYNNAGETVTFKLYNHATDTEYDNCTTTVLTNANGYGETWDPVVIEFTTPISYGPEYPWIPGNYENYMYLETQIQINGVPVTNTNWEVGAFCGNVCRGLGDADNWWVSPVNQSNILEIVVGGATGDVINFYLYDVTNSKVFEGLCYLAIDWIDGDLGDMFHPLVLNFVTEQTFTKDIVAYTPGQKDHYYLLASPIGDVNPDQVTNMLENSYDLYYFDQTGDANGKEWINYKNNAFNLVSGKGYLYANNTNVTLTFSGFPFLGDSVVTLTKDSNADFPGWNLVGNPLAQTTYINKSFYVMNSTGTELQSATSGTPISAMEGIFVVAANNNETLTFSTQAPGKGASLSIHVSQGDRSELIDRAIVGFDNTDMLPKFMLDEENTKVYIPQDGGDYAVVNAESHGELPLNFKARNNGSYTLTFNTENVDFSYLHLIDNKTGNDVDLLQTPSYSFEARYTDYDSRFKLVFDKVDDGMSDDFAFITNGNIVINGQGTVQVIDALGRIIAQYGNNVRTISTDGMTPSVYVLRLINGNDVKTQKMIVR